ncbi:MAG: hypothetical protein ACXAC7_02885 [Candidatus Hodarchaeales archaeon]|jgi:hypothetical protein
MFDLYKLLYEHWTEAMVIMGILMLILVMVELEGLEGFIPLPWFKRQFKPKEQWFRIYQQYLKWYNLLSNTSPENMIRYIEGNVINWLETEYPLADQRSPGKRRVEGKIKPYLSLIRDEELRIFLQNPYGWLKPYFDPIKELFEDQDTNLHHIGIGKLVPAFQMLESSIFNEIGITFNYDLWKKLEDLGDIRLQKRKHTRRKNNIIVVSFSTLITIIIVSLVVIFPPDTGSLMFYSLLIGTVLFLVIGITSAYIFETKIWKRFQSMFKSIIMAMKD